MFFAIGTGCPFLKCLNKYVIPDIADKWYDIGIQLLDEEDTPQLKLIKTRHGGDVNDCTAGMLQLWQEKKPDANWDQLLQVLRRPSINLNTLASKIEQMLSKGIEVCIMYHSYTLFQYPYYLHNTPVSKLHNYLTYHY